MNGVVPSPTSQPDVLLPATAAQRGLWLSASLVDASSLSHVVADAWVLPTAPDGGVQAVADAFSQAVGEADMLSARFAVVDEDVMCEIGAHTVDTIVHHDMSDQENPGAAAVEFVNSWWPRPIDPAVDPCFEAVALDLGASGVMVAARAHHIVVDAHGLGLIGRRAAQIHGHSPETTRGRYGSLSAVVAEEHDYLTSEDAAADAAFWREFLADTDDDAAASITGRTHRSGAAARIRSASRTVEAPGLSEIGARAGATWVEAIIAAVSAHASSVMARTDVTIGLPFANRMRSAALTVPTTTVNVVPLPLRLGPWTSPVEATRAVVDGVARVRPHARRRGEGMRSGVWVNVKPAGSGYRFGGVSGHTVSFARGPVDDLSVTVERNSDALTLLLDADADRYDEERLAEIADDLVRFVEDFSRRADLPCAMLSARGWPTIGGPADPGLAPGVDIGTQIVDAARRAPDAVAVESNGDVATFGEIIASAEAIASALNVRGVGPESVVAVAIPRGPRLVEAIVGVLLAGGVVAPIDPDYPTNRITMIIEDARPRAVIVDVTTPTPVFDAAGDLAVRVSDLTGPGQSPHPTVSPDNAAYLIFTSGSTGRPKGVVVSHRAIENLVWWRQAEFGLAPGERLLQKTSPGFDPFVPEILWPLVVGARIVMCPPGIDRDLGRFAQFLARTPVDFVELVPSVLSVLLETGSGPTRGSIRTVSAGGEALDTALAQRVRHTWGSDVVNTYGPAETAVEVTAERVTDRTRGTSVPIGSPIPNTTAHVLDPWLRPVGPGEVGELYLGGVQLARGYAGRVDLSSTRFVADPFDAAGGRLYRTGDLVRRAHDDGTGVGMTFVSRNDTQVKIRGHRVEPGEVEALLTAVDGVSAAAVVADRRSGEYVLAAFVAPRRGTTLRSADVLASVSAVAPPHLVPATVIVLDALPVTPSGKLDRRALAAHERPVVETVEADRRAWTYAERSVADRVEELLGAPVTDLSDDFFGLGGDSIAALRLVSRCRRDGLVLSTGEVFAAGTLRAIAGTARPADEVAAAEASETEPVGTVEPIPVMAEVLDADGSWTAGYGQSMMLRLPEEIDTEIFHAASRAVIAAHPALRMRVGQTLEIDALDLDIDLDRWIGVDHGTPEDIGERCYRGLDPAAGVLARFVHVPTTDPPRPTPAAVIAVHHLAVDAVSWSIIVDDLRDACTRIAFGREPVVAAEPVPLRAWGAALREAAVGGGLDRQIPFWREVLAPSDGVLPTRALDPARDTVGGAADLDIVLDAADTAAISAAAAAISGTVADILAAALLTALGTESVVIDMEGHGREPGPHMLGVDADLSRTVGWFTTVYPVRLTRAGVTSADRLVKTVKEQIRAVPDRGVGFGALCAHRGDTGLADAADRQILINYLGRFGGTDASGDWTAQPAPGRDGVGTLGVSSAPDMPLTHHLQINAATTQAGELTAQWRFASAAVDGDTVRGLADRWRHALADIAAQQRARRVGGVTPSDVVADVTLDDLDLFAQEWTVRDVLPVTPLQQGLLFEATFAADVADRYVVQMLLEAPDRIDVGRMRRAADRLVARHPHLGAAMRTTQAGVPVAVVPAAVRIPVDHVPASGPDSTDMEFEQQWEGLVDADRRLEFALDASPLLRLTVVDVPEAGSRIILTHHHLILDGWSSPLILRELFDGYTDESRDASTSAGGDIAAYLRVLTTRMTEPAAVAADAERWRTALADLAAPTRLTDGSEPTSGSHDVETVISAEASSSLVAAARSAGLTVNTMFQAAWAAVLASRTGQSDIVFGTSVSGRDVDVHGVESIIGLLINTVPVRISLDPSEPARALCSRVQREQAAMADVHHVPLPAVHRAVGGSDLFDTLLVFENYSDEPLPGGVVVTGVRDSTGYPVTVIVIPGPTTRIVLKHHDGVPASTAQELLDGLVSAVTALARRPEAPTFQIPAAASGEPINGGPAVFDGRTVVDLFDESAALHSDQRAVIVDEGADGTATTLSFTEHSEDIMRLARELIACGVGPESVVAVVLPRGVDLLRSVWAVVCAGGAYLPVDPDFPLDRVAGMLDDAGATHALTRSDVLADSGLVTALDDRTVDVVELDRPEVVARIRGRAAGRVTDRERVAPLRADHPMYVLFTSGSTGRPKGVVVSHTAAANRLVWAQQTYRLSTADVVVQKTPSTFDVSVWELFWPALAGAATLVIGPDAHKDASYLAAAFARHGVTTAHFVPTMLAAFLADEPVTRDARDVLHGMRVLCSGEALPRPVAKAAQDRGADVHNLYGPTEAAVDVTACRVDERHGPVPIGEPVAGTTLHILDQWLRPVPRGVVGELYLGGVQIARGYASRTALTATRFVADPTGGGRRLYRTGDLVHRDTGDDLHYVGRSDFQVKIRGQRIEPGEVESALSAVDGVRTCVVVARDLGHGPQLVGYLTGEAITADAVRAQAEAELPAHLVPTHLVVLDELPVTANGKIDRRALPEPRIAATVDGRAPQTPVEHVLVDVVAGVLGLQTSVSVDDDFFALGGDSIVSIRLVARARAAGLDFDPRDVFEARTVAALAARVRVIGTRTVTSTVDRYGPVPASPIAWVTVRRAGFERFVQLRVLSAPTGTTVDDVRTALAVLVSSHEVLGARLAADGALEIPPNPVGPVPVTVGEPAGTLAPADVEAALEDAFARLDPDGGVMLAAHWWPTGDGGRLLLVAHHLVVDAYSWRVLLDDLRALAEGDDLEPAATSYRQWMTELRPALTAQTDRAQADPPESDPQPLADTVGTAHLRTVEVDAGSTDVLLHRPAAAYRATTQDVIVAAVMVALGATGHDLDVDVEDHGRAHGDWDLSRTVGWFTTVIGLRVEGGDTSPDGLLRAVKEARLAVLHNGAALPPHRAAEVLVNYLGADTTAQASAEPPTSWHTAAESAAFAATAESMAAGLQLSHRIQLDVELVEHADGSRLQAQWRIARSVPAADVDAFVDAWRQGIDALVAHLSSDDSGGLTPSDTLVSISQAELDDLVDFDLEDL